MLSSDADNASNPVALRQSILAQLGPMRTKVSGILAQQSARYNSYFDEKFSSIPSFTVPQMVVVNRSLLTKFSAERKSAHKCNKLLLQTTRTLKVLKVRNRVLELDENDTANTIPIDKTTPVGS